MARKMTLKAEEIVAEAKRQLVGCAVHTLFPGYGGHVAPYASRRPIGPFHDLFS
jgi:hypothetical protein